MVLKAQREMTAAAYREWEARQEVKHEYIDGEIIEMTGGTLTHSRIKTNISGNLFALLDHNKYVLCNSDIRLRISPTRYVYPDFSIVRGMPRTEDDSELSLLNPVFVVEVTSPSSDTYDRVDKFGYYLEVPSIEAYLIVDQERVRADLCTRAGDGWFVRVYAQPSAALPLDAIGCALPLAAVYRGISLE